MPPKGQILAWGVGPGLAAFSRERATLSRTATGASQLSYVHRTSAPLAPLAGRHVRPTLAAEMRMRTLLILGSLVLVAACSNKKDSPSGGVGASPAASEITGALDCDRVLSKDLRAKYFASATIKNNPQAIAQAAECKITMGEEDANFTVTCHDNMAAAMTASLESLKKNLGAKDLPGVGRGAVTVDMGGGAVHVTAWDDDSNCSISAAVPKSIDATAFAKDLLASLPPR